MQIPKYLHYLHHFIPLLVSITQHNNKLWDFQSLKKPGIVTRDSYHLKETGEKCRFFFYQNFVQALKQGDRQDAALSTVLQNFPVKIP